MHIANITSASLDGQVEPIDLQQTPADVVVLSFSDSDLSAVKLAYEVRASEISTGRLPGPPCPSMRLAALNDLRHPMSVDLWIDSVARHARVIVVRILGGYDWWSYGCDQLAAVARQHNIALALLPGESHSHDDRLAALSTVEQGVQGDLLALFRAGGPANMATLLKRCAGLAGHQGVAGNDPNTLLNGQSITPVAPMGFYAAGIGVVDIEHFVAATTSTASVEMPVVHLLFYRAMLLAGETAPIDALVNALAKHHILAVPIFVPTLKRADVVGFVKDTANQLPPSIMITTTAFAASLDTEGGGASLFDHIGVPVLQAIIATTRLEAWDKGERGLGTSDIAMHVVLPELDGRILAGVLSFKDFEYPVCNDGDIEDVKPAIPAGPLQFNALQNRPVADRVGAVAGKVAALIKLQTTPEIERRLLIIMPDYPGADGRTGYAVGLDVPASVLAMLSDLAVAGYDVSDIPQTSRDLLAAVAKPKPALSARHYADAFQKLPERSKADVIRAWGEPLGAKIGAGKPSDTKAFDVRYACFGSVTVALAPDRGRTSARRADYHDPELPPRHELLAFGLWAQTALDCQAIVHCGAHGTLEWLPGKAVALSRACFPEIATRALPIIYPFIVNNPGEAAQAKRRIGALTIGHMPPPMIDAGLTAEQHELERLVDEYVQADGLDGRRQKRLAELILEKAAATRLDADAGVAPGTDDGEALKRIDTWLCDLKDFAIKDGQHIFARPEPDCKDPSRLASAALERDNFLAALNGKFVTPGPAGSPSRGRTDIYPTGRNLFTIDPRMMPTNVAVELGTKAADEVLQLYLQDHGDWPRALVINLWASASLRTGGEEIAQGLALLGCRPQWDNTTGRMTGVEVLPPAAMGRPRIDVTWRISGLFRDMFPAQIALMSVAIDAIARRGEEDGDNPLAAEFKASGVIPKRIFGSSPGTYGSGVEALLESGDWQTRDELGEAYIAAGSYAFSGADGVGELVPGVFGNLLAQADLLVHNSDDTGHDLLEGSADVAYLGGFAAAVEAIGGNADLICLDTTDPGRPRARSLGDAIRRVVRARATNPRYIRGQMRHGPRGASDFAETVDRLIGFSETTNAVPAELIDALYDAYVDDADVRDFMLRENPEAAHAVASRMENARNRGLWHPRRNSTADGLQRLIDDADLAMRAESIEKPAKNGPATKTLTVKIAAGEGSGE